MQQTKTWCHTVPGLFHAEKCRESTPKRTSFSPSRASRHRAPEKCKESVFEVQIL